jgi:murein DD-endopeptidase MepM/ murein hydrolase activator NlpD
VFDESAPENFAYPWRDNFCETRDSQVGQCPGGYGHQGQDIRGSHCLLNNEGADRCEPYQHDVVAVRDGRIWRTPGYLAAYISVNTANERARFRYMHLNPFFMDRDALVSGRRVAQGEVVGKLANYGDYEKGTSYHLHFDMQVFTRDGWVWVNPYMTLVSAYERLIGAHGREIETGGTAPIAGAMTPLIANRGSGETPAFAASQKPAVETIGSIKAKPKKRIIRKRRKKAPVDE